MSIHPSTILLVDDDPEALTILQRLLETLTQGYRIVTADSGAAALAVLASSPIALVITDYEMPEMHGAELAEAIKSISPATRVVIVTVHDVQDVAQRAPAGVVEAVLAKPFIVDQLRQLVATLDPYSEEQSS